MKVYTICDKHNSTVLVGPGTLLEELECVTCVAIADGILPAAAPALTDAETIFISNITRHYGGNCCCESCDPSFCYNCNHYSLFCVCPGKVSLYRWTPKRRWGGEVPF